MAYACKSMIIYMIKQHCKIKLESCTCFQYLTAFFTNDSHLFNPCDVHIMIECRSDERHFLPKHYVHKISVVHVDGGGGGIRAASHPSLPP